MGYWISNFIRRAWFERSDKYKGLFSNRFHHRVLECLEEKSSYSFLNFKEEYLIKSLWERIDKSGLSSVDYYIRLLENSAEEQEMLTQSIFKNVWVDKKDWTKLLELEELFREIKPELNGIRIWIAGCGNGLEAYVVAMLLSDYMEPYEWNEQIKIFATDLEENIVADAVKGYFEYKDIEELPKSWIGKYFQNKGSDYQVSQKIRNMIIFSVHDILTNPPFARMSLLICRDVLGKYRIHSRKAMIARFAYSLKEGGYLVLGRNEDMSELCSWFGYVEKYDGRIWRKQRNAPPSLDMPIFNQESFSVGNVIQELLAASMPSCIIVDERYEILYTGKGASKYLQFKSGRFSKNLFDNVDIRIGVLIDTALKYLQEGKEWQEVMTLKSADGAETDVNIHVLGQTIRNRCYYLIWFEELINEEQQNKKKESFRKREEKLEREIEISQNKLCQALRELDETKDKYELINEKLQSTNEELILMNDELQMVNQELAASNRKLTRVNTEYQKKINELPDFSLEGIDFFNLLGLQIIFLDSKMRIKKISERVPEITNIRESDLDRGIADINIMNGYLGWSDDVKAAEDGEKVFRVINGDGGSRFIIEILPYISGPQELPEYIIAIQKIEKGGKKKHGAGKQKG